MDAWGPIRHPEFYVWDHVAVALHMENRQVLRFDPDQLRENLRFCWRDNRTIIPQTHFDHFRRAHSLLRRLWPGYSWLEKEPPLRPT
ncbi:unnamed protein product [Oreochromis niloticus]|nr:unnamed protein product [Mustela putorius furo]